jgi:hypothetical protein
LIVQTDEQPTVQHRLITDTDNSEAINAWAMDLFAKVNIAFVGRRLDQAAVDGIKQLIQDEAARARAEGLQVPDLVVIPLPKQNSMEIVRQDLDLAGVANTIVRIGHKYPGITPREIAWAIRQAFPGYAKALRNVMN